MSDLEGVKQDAEINEGSNQEPLQVEVVDSDIRAEEPIGYEPNSKFKVHDEEHEFDEIYKPLLKDADTEKSIRELHEKAYGLDVVKPKYQKVKEEKSELYTKYTDLAETVTELSKCVTEKDYDTFFEKCGVSEEDLYDHVQKKLQYKELPVEERKQLDEYSELRKQNKLLAQQNTNLSQGRMQDEVKRTESEVLSFTTREDINPIVKEYDARMGKQGAFVDAVFDIGATHYYKTNKKESISVTQAMNTMLASIGAINTIPSEHSFIPTIQTNNNKQTLQSGSEAPSQQAPVIPNVSGSAVTPARKSFKSLAELRAFREQMQ